MRVWHGMVIAGCVFVVLATPAEAQRRRGGGGFDQPTARPAGEPYDRQRGRDIYSRQPGGSGTIQWNTPNASGNLGGPGTGGGGGSGG